MIEAAIIDGGKVAQDSRGSAADVEQPLARLRPHGITYKGLQPTPGTGGVPHQLVAIGVKRVAYHPDVRSGM